MKRKYAILLILVVLLLLVIIFRDYIRVFCEAITVPIGPGGLPKDYPRMN